MKHPVRNLRSAPFLLILLLVVSLSLQAETRDPLTHFFHQSFGDLSEELETVKDENKAGVLIMFEAEDCPFCARMKKTILNQSQVQDYFREHFQIIKIDMEGDVEITDFNGDTVSMKSFSYDQHRVRATPVFAVFDSDGQLIKGSRYTGAMTGVDEFMLYGQYIVDKHYEKQSFTRYKRSQKD